MNNLRHSTYKGEMALWDNFEYALERIKGFVLDETELPIAPKPILSETGDIINVETGMILQGIKGVVEATKCSQNSVYAALNGKAIGMVNIHTHEFIKCPNCWHKDEWERLAGLGFVRAHFVRK